jgi:hypothetical protein
MLSLIGNPSSLYLNRALHGRAKMANYISRVELHSASYEDYETLHGAMQRQGYSRTIVGDDGATYNLPTGTYDVSGTTASLAQALNAAEAAAKETKKKYSIIVAERTAARWTGLSKIETRSLVGKY